MKKKFSEKLKIMVASKCLNSLFCTAIYRRLYSWWKYYQQDYNEHEQKKSLL